MDIQELKRKINKIINDEKMPNKVKQTMEDIYKEYEQACFECKYALTTIMDSHNVEQIKEIQRYIRNDIEENKESIDTVNKQEFEIKKEKLIERIERELDKLEGKNSELQPILFDSNEEEKMYKENKVNIENRNEDRLNIEAFIREIMNNIISEIESSKKYIKSRINDIEINSKDEAGIYLRNNAVKDFEENVEYIIRKIRNEVPELGKVLEKQDNVVYKYIEDAINEYQKENSEEKTSKEKCKDFRQSLSEGVKVDEEEALQKVEERLQEEEKQKTELYIELD